MSLYSTSANPMAGYPTDVANKIEDLVDSYGPLSYATGGYEITAAQLGWGGIEFAQFAFVTVETVNSVVMPVAVDSSGTYFVGLKPSTYTGPCAYVTVQWYVLSTGAEVTASTNLNANKVRIHFRGV